VGDIPNASAVISTSPGSSSTSSCGARSLFPTTQFLSRCEPISFHTTSCPIWPSAYPRYAGLHQGSHPRPFRNKSLIPNGWGGCVTNFVTADLRDAGSGPGIRNGLAADDAGRENACRLRGLEVVGA
jgi:hypothetical protein